MAMVRRACCRYRRSSKPLGCAGGALPVSPASGPGSLLPGSLPKLAAAKRLRVPLPRRSSSMSCCKCALTLWPEAAALLRGQNGLRCMGVLAALWLRCAPLRTLDMPAERDERVGSS